MFVRYILLSKGNGSQTLVPQRDALLATGGDLDRLSEDLSSFRDNDHPGLVARLKAIQPSNILVVWKLDPLGQNLKYRIIRSDIPERVLPPPDLCPGLTSVTSSRHSCTGSQIQALSLLMILGIMMKTDIIKKNPHLELVASSPIESFRWHMHDFPCNIARWNYHPEHEIHLIRESTERRLSVTTSASSVRLPHGGRPESATQLGQRSRTRPDRAGPGRRPAIRRGPVHTRWREVFPEVTEIVPLLNGWHRGLQFHGETATARHADGATSVKPRASIGCCCSSHLVRRLAQSSEHTPLASTDYVPSLDQDAPRIIQKVMSYILENFKDTVSLSEAAEIAGMSEFSFSRFFKKNSGNNFVDYVRKLRVSHACRILSETNVPVTEVCFEVGYNNISNFNRHFLAEKSVTPSQYRRMSARKFTAEASG